MSETVTFLSHIYGNIIMTLPRFPPPLLALPHKGWSAEGPGTETPEREADPASVVTDRVLRGRETGR